MLGCLTVGALNEAWESVRTRSIERTIAKDYLNRLDAVGQETFAALKRQFGESNLHNTLRKNYAFHYPRSDDVDKSSESICNDPELDGLLNLYFSNHGFNSLFLLSDLVFIHGIAEMSGQPDLQSAQKKHIGRVQR